MQFVVIAMADDRLNIHLADGAAQALNVDRKFRDQGSERVTFTDGQTFFSREQLEDMARKCKEV